MDNHYIILKGFFILLLLLFNILCHKNISVMMLARLMNKRIIFQDSQVEVSSNEPDLLLNICHFVLAFCGWLRPLYQQYAPIQHTTGVGGKQNN